MDFRKAIGGSSTSGSEDSEVIVNIDVPAVEAALERGEDIVLPFAGGSRTLSLLKQEIYAPNAQLVIEGKDGITTEPLESGSYQGSFLSPDGRTGRATLTVHSPYLSALLSSSDRSEWIRTDQTEQDVRYYAGQRDIRRVSTPSGEDSTPNLAPPPSPQLTHDDYECYRDEPVPFVYWEDIVPHADHSYYQLKGSSTTAVRNDIEADINRVNDVWGVQTCTKFQILGIPIHTYGPGEVLTSTECVELRDQFRDHFQAVHDDNYWFDVAHLFSGKDFDSDCIGAAYLDGRYAVTQHVDPCTGLCQPDWWYDAAEDQRFLLISHEVGHNYNAWHYMAAEHCWWIFCDFTIMKKPLENILSDFSDLANTRIRSERPKANT